MLDHLAQLAQQLDANASLTLKIARSSCTELRGRDALAELCNQMEPQTENANRTKNVQDTFCIRMPHTNLSLTHSGCLAMAFYAHINSSVFKLAGAGIDFEQPRSVNPRSARFFLLPTEQSWLETIAPPEQNSQLLRMWTVKEALFKADITNCCADSDRFPGQYETFRPGLLSGFARHRALPDVQFIYSSTVLASGAMTTAVALTRH